MLEIGILKNFDSATYKAAVQLVGSLTTYFDNVSVAVNIATASMVVGNFVILAIPQGNPKDACVIAAWPSGSAGGLVAHGSTHEWLGADEVHAYNSFLNIARLLHCDWQVVDYWTQTVSGTGSITIGILNTRLLTGGTSGGTALLRTTAAGFNMNAAYLRFQGTFVVTDPGDNVMWLISRLGGTTVGDTVKHAGFKIINGRVWCSSSDGANQETTDTGIDLLKGETKSFIVTSPDAGVSYKFYIEDVLVATHTTYLPTSTSNHYIIMSHTNTANTANTWKIQAVDYVQP